MMLVIVKRQTACGAIHHRAFVGLNDCNVEIGKRSIKYRGIKLWNNLRDDLKNTTSLLSFKYRLKSYLLHTIE